MAKKTAKMVSLPIKFTTPPAEDLKLKAFLFSRNGKLLEIADVKNEKVSFSRKIPDHRKVRVLLAPSKSGIENVGRISELKDRFKAFEPVISVDKNQIELSPVPDFFIPGWLFRKCRVRGNVSKIFEISGQTEKLPLCNVRVHICEVDRLILRIPRIPDDILTKIPDLILEPEIPIPVPLPDPPPIRIPDLPPVFPNRPAFRRLFRRDVNPFDLPVVRELRRPLVNKPINPELVKPSIFNQDIRAKLLTREPAMIQAVLRENFELFHPIFCHIPWLWPYFYRCDELAVVQTDLNGQFDTSIIYSLFGDKPDLYFWVEAYIDGEWTTVYKPNIPCNTYWDYNCGSEVDILVTDPRVMWGCDNEIDGEIIWIKTIGHGTSVSRIQQVNDSGTFIQGTSMNRIGLTDKLFSKGDYRSPFGKSLYIIVQFSSGLPVNNYYYYRWSYKKIRNADLSAVSGPLVQIANERFKHYTYEFIDTDGDKQFGINHFRLGPYSVGAESNLYHITPPSPADAPVNAPESSTYWDQNTVSIGFDTTGMGGDGLYELTLELFDKTGARKTNIPNELFKVPHFDTFAPSVNAPAINLHNSGPGTCDAFKMVMRVDNSLCQAEIYSVKISAGGGAPFVSASPNCCGFVPYHANSEVQLEFRAYHPQNLANYSFRVNKGTCGTVPDANSSGMVLSKIGSPAIGGSVNHYLRNVQSRFKKDFTPNGLLGTCSLKPDGTEGKAAFAQHLDLDALAVNGNRRLHEYDSGDLAAFALEPV